MGSSKDFENRGLRGSQAIATNIIKKRRDYPHKKFLSFLIVEGDTDSKFYKTLVDINKCQVTIADGKSVALEVLSILEKEGVPGILVILDADFNILEGKSSHSQNLLFTDTHDLETMFIKSPALEKVLVVHGSEEKITKIVQSVGSDVRKLLLECGGPIGYLRWASLREDLSLKFEGLNYGKFIKEGLKVDQSLMIEAVKNNSSKRDIATTKLQAYIENLRAPDHDLLDVCCGHDLVWILSIGLRKTIGSKELNEVRPDSLEKDLLFAFERSYFYKTQLYLSIQQWEKTNTPFVILASE